MSDSFGGGNEVGVKGWSILTQFVSSITQVLSTINTTLKTLAIGASGNNSFTGNNTFTGTNTFKPPPVISAGATGTGTLLPEGAISVQLNRSGIGNGADKTNDTLFSYGLPAKSFDADGRGVRLLAWGDFAANGNDKVITFQINGSIIYNTGTMTDNASWWRLEAEVYRDGSSTQSGTAVALHGSATPWLGPTSFATSVTDTNVITFSVTGASPTTGAAKDVVGHGMTVEFLN